MKVFCIGLSKTGTTSLARALEVLEYRTKDNLGVANFTSHNLSSIDLNIIDENDAFTDTPIPSFYKELDAKYPNSKFILTTREMDGWLKSCKKQFTKNLANKQNDAHNQLFIELYGTTVFDEEKFKEGYKQFVNEVYKHFSDRQHDLLSIDISAGGGWEPLCRFLEKPVPDMPFPKANVTQIRWMNIEDVISIAQQAGKDSQNIYKYIRGDQPGPGITVAGTFRMLRYLFQKARYRFGTDKTIPAKISWYASQQIITKSLKSLNPEIPIIHSGNSDAIPYNKRRKWNHFWLIEPFNSSNMQSRDTETVYSLSISLIEDRTPILGVVYTPSTDITHYAMAGKGAFKVKNKQKPEKLRSRQEHNGDSLAHSGDAPSAFDIPGEDKSACLTDTLKMCLVAEGKWNLGLTLSGTMEWQTAAAHAIAIATGMRVITCDSNEEITYNKEDFSNGCIVME